MMFGKKLREAKEQKLREKEEKRRQAERKKKRQLKILVGTCGGILAACLLICAIGSLAEVKSVTVPEPPVSTSAVTDVESTTSNETPTQTPEATEPSATTVTPAQKPEAAPAPAVEYSVSDIPAYTGAAYIALNNNTPSFSESDLTTTSFEIYSDLDSL